MCLIFQLERDFTHHWRLRLSPSCSDPHCMMDRDGILYIQPLMPNNDVIELSIRVIDLIGNHVFCTLYFNIANSAYSNTRVARLSAIGLFQDQLSIFDRQRSVHCVPANDQCSADDHRLESMVVGVVSAGGRLP